MAGGLGGDSVNGAGEETGYFARLTITRRDAWPKRWRKSRFGRGSELAKMLTTEYDVT